MVATAKSGENSLDVKSIEADAHDSGVSDEGNYE